MTQVISATVHEVVYFGRKEGTRIEITTNGTSDFIYEKKFLPDGDSIIRSEDGDVGSFYCLSDNQNGFGGHTYKFKMFDGTTIEHKGPWSSRAGVINMLWPKKEPLVECVDVGKCNVITYVRKDVLERLGIKLEREEIWGGEIYFRAV